jgi:hypothetical protein
MEVGVTPERVLAHAASILVIDWPSRDVPETLTRSGYAVFVKGGPGPEDYAAWELRDSQVVVTPSGRPPRGVDVVYCHRPVAELPGILAVATELGAATVWLQSGLTGDGTRDPKGCWLPDGDAAQARTLVERAGLHYVGAPYIADVARGLPVDGAARRARYP